MATQEIIKGNIEIHMNNLSNLKIAIAHWEVVVSEGRNSTTKSAPFEHEGETFNPNMWDCGCVLCHDGMFKDNCSQCVMVNHWDHPNCNKGGCVYGSDGDILQNSLWISFCEKEERFRRTYALGILNALKKRYEELNKDYSVFGGLEVVVEVKGMPDIHSVVEAIDFDMGCTLVEVGGDERYIKCLKGPHSKTGKTYDPYPIEWYTANMEALRECLVAGKFPVEKPNKKAAEVSGDRSHGVNPWDSNPTGASCPFSG